jgi:type IV secretory pathway TrbF-like protein
MSEETKNNQPGSATADGAAQPGYTDPAFAERYGVKRGMSRTRKILLAVFGLALLGGVVGYIAWNEANPKIQAEVISYTVNGTSINVTFQVNKSADQRVECTIEALDTHGSVIGSANVVVPSGRAQEDMVYTVNTTGTPNTAEVPSCTAVS